MITTARPLRTIQLIKKSQMSKNNITVWGENVIITHKTWVSLLLILKWMKNKKNDKPVLYVPDYFCDETLRRIRKEAIVVFYNVTENLTPDYKKCALLAKEVKPDLFLFVHYFGKVLNASTAKNFCKNNSALLIEDATHCLYPQKNVGAYGDFTLFSPWKSCGLIDGAILKINSNGIGENLTEQIRDELEGYEKKLDDYPEIIVTKWKLKKMIQKIVPNRKYRKGEGILRTTQLSADRVYQVSDMSNAFLNGIQMSELQILGERKKENSLLIAEYLRDKYNVELLWDWDGGIPYALVVKTENQEKKQQIIEDISRIGMIASEWPDLPEDLPEDSIAEGIKRNTLLISVHDGLDFERIKRKLKIKKENEISKLDIVSITEGEYRALCGSVEEPLSILQSVSYVVAKKEVQDWNVNYYKIVDSCEEDNCVGFFLVLKKYGVIYRINHGPIIQKQHMEDAMRAIRKKFSGCGKILFFAPSIERTGENYLRLLRMGYHYRKTFFTTGYIDLKADEDILRKNLDSKWRNCLKNAEKRNLFVECFTEENDFETLLELHSMDKEKRKYSDSGDAITRNLFKQDKIMSLVVKNEAGEVISFIMTVIHEKSATYYIGWSNSEGYKCNASRLLLWTSMLMAKEKGVEWFDLGGIDFINTKGVAEFKTGSGCKVFEYIGEFIAL